MTAALTHITFQPARELSKCQWCHLNLWLQTC